MPFPTNGACPTSHILSGSFGVNLAEMVSVFVMPDETLQIQADPEKPLTINISETLIYDGAYTVSAEVLALGMTNLVPPALPQTATIPETLIATPGLWLMSELVTSVVQSQWQIDAQGNGDFADIENATTPSLVLRADHAGKTLRLREDMSFEGQMLQSVSNTLTP